MHAKKKKRKGEGVQQEVWEKLFVLNGGVQDGCWGGGGGGLTIGRVRKLDRQMEGVLLCFVFSKNENVLVLQLNSSINLNTCTACLQNARETKLLLENKIKHVRLPVREEWMGLPPGFNWHFIIHLRCETGNLSS